MVLLFLADTWGDCEEACRIIRVVRAGRDSVCALSVSYDIFIFLPRFPFSPPRVPDDRHLAERGPLHVHRPGWWLVVGWGMPVARLQLALPSQMGTTMHVWAGIVHK